MEKGTIRFQLIVNEEYLALVKKYQELQQELSDVIECREHMAFHEALYLKTQYMARVGVYEVECFRYFIEYERLKREITLIQAALNREEPIDEEAIEEQVDLECEEYQAHLQQMEFDLNIANFILDCPMLSEEESIELKKIYKQLAKKLHPDMNVKVTKKQEQLWSLVQDAYKRGDLELLKSLEHIAGELSDQLEDAKGDTMSILREKIVWISRRIKQFEGQIKTMRKNYPFNQEEFLNDKIAVEQRKKGCLEQTKRYQELIEELKERRREMLQCSTPTKP